LGEKKLKTPDVKVVKNERINISIWLVPIVALIISLWLAYQYFSQLGPKITIKFDTSSGLKVKQSQIKYRDVSIGIIKKIALTDGGKGVIVTARINKDAQDLINSNAKFWIVKPKIDKSGITGLETLVSGSYIELNSVEGGEEKEDFIGLKEAYTDEKSIAGKHFFLDAPNSYDIDIGAIVFYRNIEVGEVKNVELSESGKKVIFDIFIKDPYSKFVNGKTQFSYMSNFKIDLSKSRLDVSLASSSQLIYGGISFNTPTKSTKKYPLKDGHIFPLFSSVGEAGAKRAGFNSENITTFQMNFNQNLGKLSIGASVMFDNFQVGEVCNIESKFQPDTNSIKSVVLVDIDTSIFNEKLKNGFVAKLAKSNPILDSLLIELEFDNNQSYHITQTKPYDTFPTKEVRFEDLGGQVKLLLASVKNLVDKTEQPIQSILKNLNSTIKNANKLTKNKKLLQLPDQLSQTIIELENTLKSVQNTIGENSKMSDDISESMKNLNKASIALERVLRKIDKKPNSLIFGD
jgi:paraquat-inducible protein B